MSEENKKRLARALSAREPELRNYSPPWYDSVAYALTDLVNGPNATAQQTSAMKRLVGKDSPIPMAAEATGIPSVIRGGGNMYEGAASGSPSQFAAGAGEAALGALPAASLARPVAPLVNSMFSSAPKAAASLAAPAAAMVPYGVEQAQASSVTNASRAVNDSPDVARLRSELQAVERERLEASSKPIKGMNTKSADEARARIDATFGQREDALRQQLEQAETAARATYSQNAPFRERYPGAAESLMTGAVALSGAIPFAKGLKSNLAESMVTVPGINRQAEAVERALGSLPPKPTAMQRLMGKTPPSRGNEQAFSREQDVLNRKLDRYNADHRPNAIDRSLGMSEAQSGKYLGNAIFGMGLTTEARLVPEEVDALVFPPGHPTREAAISTLANPMTYLSALPAALLGGGMTSSLGTKAADLVSKSKPDLSRAEAAASWSYPHRGPASNPLPPTGPAPGGGGGGSAGTLPNPQPAPNSGQTSGSRPNGPVSYSAQQQDVVRSLVDSTVMAGGSVPDRAALVRALTDKGVGTPSGPLFNARQDNTAQYVKTMQEAGASPQQILAGIMAMRDSKMPILGVGAAAGLGLGYGEE